MPRVGDGHLEKAERELGEVHDELSGAQSEMRSAYTRIEEQGEQIAELEARLEAVSTDTSTDMSTELEKLKRELAAEKEKTQGTWRTTCEQAAQQDAQLTAKDDEIAALKQRVTELQVARSASGLRSHREPETSTVPTVSMHTTVSCPAGGTVSCLPGGTVLSPARGTVSCLAGGTVSCPG